MRLASALLSYVDYKRGLGMKFHTEPRIVAAYGRAAGEIDIAEVTSAIAQRFLMPTGRQTRASEIKYWALRGFYKFAIARRYVSRSPLPTRMTTQPQVLVPHIYSRQELVQLLKRASTRYMRAPRVEPAVIHALIALMYGAGLRISEAVGLTLADVDVRQQQIYVRNTKFYKTRLVPLDPRLAQALGKYLAVRNQRHSIAPTAPVFVYRQGQRLSRESAQHHFRFLCRRAGFGVPGGIAIEPRLHDLRHTAAVHRVLAWYRGGRDVQALLPNLATYLGHKDVASTQRYLRLIPELLNEANRRFEIHSKEVYSHD